MKKSRFTEEQIAFALKQHEAGVTVAEITRRLGVSEQTFYRWRKKYGGVPPVSWTVMGWRLLARRGLSFRSRSGRDNRAPSVGARDCTSLR